MFQVTKETLEERRHWRTKEKEEFHPQIVQRHKHYKPGPWMSERAPIVFASSDCAPWQDLDRRTIGVRAQIRNVVIMCTGKSTCVFTCPETNCVHMFCLVLVLFA
jgi:hypothetical protein